MTRAALERILAEQREAAAYLLVRATRARRCGSRIGSRRSWRFC